MIGLCLNSRVTFSLNIFAFFVLISLILMIIFDSLNSFLENRLFPIVNKYLNGDISSIAGEGVR